MHLRIAARTVIGTAMYYSDGREIFHWEHAWVRVGGEVIDGNADSLFENPMVPPTVKCVGIFGCVSAFVSAR